MLRWLLAFAAFLAGVAGCTLLVLWLMSPIAGDAPHRLMQSQIQELRYRIDYLERSTIHLSTKE